MDKITIYLSKSKAGNMGDLMAVRSYLSRFTNVEVVEFIGSSTEYDIKKLINYETNIVLVLPHTPPLKYHHYFDMGRGQTEEVNRAERLGIPVYGIISTGLETMLIAEYVEYDHVNKSHMETMLIAEAKHYATIYCLNTPQLFEEEIVIIGHILVGKSHYSYGVIDFGKTSGTKTIHKITGSFQPMKPDECFERKPKLLLVRKRRLKK